MQPAQPFPLIAAQLAAKFATGTRLGDAREPTQLAANPVEYWINRDRRFRNDESIEQPGLRASESYPLVIHSAETSKHLVAPEPFVGNDTDRAVVKPDTMLSMLYGTE